MRMLPQTALDDLRRRYRLLERTFQVPEVDIAAATPAPYSPPLPVGFTRGGELLGDASAAPLPPNHTHRLPVARLTKSLSSLP